MIELALRDARKEFGKNPVVTALRGVNVDVERGDFVAITGPSGGGKSTLLNLLGLLDQPTAGSTQIGEVDASSLADRALTTLRARAFGFIFQGFHLLDRRPTFHSVELGLLYQGTSSAARRTESARALASVGLLDKAWVPANKLSGGERQRVAIARALASHADIVVADEPTGNLDSGNAGRIVDLLLELNSRGTTVILVTHSEEVAAVAARRLQLRDGRIINDERVRPMGAPPPATTREGDRVHRLRWRDVLRDAFWSVRSRGTRSIGLVAAVAVAVGLAVATLGLNVTAAAQVADTFNAHTSQDVTAQWSAGGVSDLPRTEMDSLVTRTQHIHGVRHAALLDDLGAQSVAALDDRDVLQASAMAGTADTVAAIRADVRWASGSSPTRHTIENGLLVGETLSKQLHLAPVDLQPTLSVNGQSMPVVGIILASPRFPTLMGGVLTPKRTTGGGREANQQYMAVLTKPGAAQQVGRELPRLINPYSSTSISVDVPKDPSTLRADVQNDVQGALIAFTVIAVLAAIAGLANAMVLSVLERRQEIGLRRAVGAQRRDIASLVMVESTVIGLIGGVLGLFAAVIGVLAVTVVHHWTPTFDIRLIPVALAGGIVVGLLGGAVAGHRGSRIAPSEALRL